MNCIIAEKTRAIAALRALCATGSRRSVGMDVVIEEGKGCMDDR